MAKKKSHVSENLDFIRDRDEQFLEPQEDAMAENVLYTAAGAAVNDPTKLLTGMLNGPVRLVKVEFDEEKNEYDPLFEVFGLLTLFDPNGVGEYLVTSQSPDTAVGNLNYQFHVAQVVMVQPGNPNEILVKDREKVGLI